MEPEHLVWAGLALIAVPFLISILGAVQLWVPVGVFLILVGGFLYVFKKRHESRMDNQFEREV